MTKIARLHGITKDIVSNMDTKFTSTFWKSIFVDLGTHINFSTTYHPQTDGKNERVNQILEYMLRMYVMDKPGKWEDSLHLVEFACNNHFQVLVGLSPFEIFYGQK